ncbi:MAG: enoyl-CoA hydratase-related protein [Saccharofermentanales bacterium]
MSTILLEQKDHIAELTINRPEELNALNRAVLHELSDILGKLEEDGGIRALILTGAGDRAFVAGADIEEMADMNRTEAEIFARFGNRVMRQLSSFSAPVIAAINGYALGGGFELALACDLRIASRKARFAFPETGLGITPGFGGTQRLPRLAGPMIALDLILTGRRITADEARELLIINEVTEAEDLMPRARETARIIASKAPCAIREAKRAIRQGMRITLDEGLVLEGTCFGRCFKTEDQKRAMRAFLDKEEPPAFTGE